MTAPSFNWIKQISPAVMQWDQVPLYGSSPPFPWAELSEELSKLFQLEGLKISHKETAWRNPDVLTDGLGSEPVILQIGVANIEGMIAWAMSKKDITLIMEKLLNQTPDDFVALDKDFYTGFYHYLAAQTFHTLSTLEFGKNLNPGLIEGVQLPSQPSLCQDVEIVLGEKKASGRFIISPEALASWKQRWADRSLSTALDSPLAEKLQVIVHLEIGNVKLDPREWKSISPGDFLTLDLCSYDPEAAKGRVMMTVNGVPMFRARLKSGNIKILEFPFYHEAPMNNNEHEENNEMEEHEEPIEEEGSIVEEETEESEEMTEEETVEEEAQEEEAEAPPAKAVGGQEKRVSPADIPLNIIVEVGRLQMSVQKLMELEPGNTLELDVHPESGVDLVVNGRRIGKGELLRIGDNLGVRILDIG